MAGGRNKWTRREFVVKSGAAGLGLALGRSAAGTEKAASAEAAEALVGTAGMPLAVLGRTGEKVSILGFGSIGVPQRPRLLSMGIEQGIDFIDTAEGYDGGKSEETVGEVL